MRLGKIGVLTPSCPHESRYPLFLHTVLFFFFLACWVFIVSLLSPVAMSRGNSLLGAWTSHCGGFSCYRAWALECGLHSCSARA